MPADKTFVENLKILMTPLGDVRIKNMFGGYGLFLDGIMFALVTRNDELFLRTDDKNRTDHEALGLDKFGKMPYHAPPAEVRDSWSGLSPWVENAVAASRRAKGMNQ